MQRSSVFNRLSTYTADGVTASYTYDGDNLRQSKMVNGSTVNHLLDGANVVADIYQDSTNVYVYGNGVELFKTGGQTSRYTKSYRGDVTAVTTGDERTEYFYDNFGNKQKDTDTSTNPFEYCGEYFDDETGLIYLRNRYYDPTNGRFVTEDPARDGENWYVYAGNNPINFVDFWGLEYIVVSGSEHNTLADRRYKYNFIEPAIKKLTELKQLNDGENITWLVSSTGYSDEDISNFTETAANLGVNICFFADKTEFLSYINEKSVPGGTAYRDADKIKK